MAKKPVSYLAGSMVIGTVIGAVVGLLAAPMSGRDARQNISKRARDMSRDLPKRLGSLPNQGKDALKRLKTMPRPFTRKPNGAVAVVDEPERTEETSS